MNIEQIAFEVADELFLGGKAIGHEPVEFLRRCLSKLAEQDVEPVAHMYPDKTGPLVGKCFVGGAQTGDIPLYTETQLLAAQQRTAEACAKVCNSRAAQHASETREDEADKCAEAIRRDWREYL